LPSLPAGGSDAGPFHLPHNQASGSTLRMGQLIRASLHSCLAHYVYESLAPTPAHGLLIACRQVPSEKRKRQSPFIMRSRGGCSVCFKGGCQQAKSNKNGATSCLGVWESSKWSLFLLRRKYTASSQDAFRSPALQKRPSGREHGPAGAPPKRVAVWTRRAPPSWPRT
jgi:hypothetical protein